MKPAGFTPFPLAGAQPRRPLPTNDGSPPEAAMNKPSGIGKEIVGTIGGGRHQPTGKIDIAVMQSLSRKGEVDPLVENYGQVIVDECHHVGAVSFDSILKSVKARYVL